MGFYIDVNGNPVNTGNQTGYQDAPYAGNILGLQQQNVTSNYGPGVYASQTPGVAFASQMNPALAIQNGLPNATGGGGVAAGGRKLKSRALSQTGQYNDDQQKMMTFAMPNGGLETVPITAADVTGHANQQLQDILNQGGQPVDAQGNIMQNAQPPNPDGSPNLTGINGGTLWITPNGPQTLAQITGNDPTGAIAQAVQNYLAAGWKPGDPPLPQGQNPPLSPDAAASVPGYKQPVDPGGLIANPNNPTLPLIPQITLNQPPQIPTSIPSDVTQNISDITKQVSDAIGGQYDLAKQNMPTAQAAQTNLSSVPQVTAQNMQISPEVQQMLSGTLGYSPDVLARMKANAVDTTSQAGGQQLAQARRALERQGVGAGAESAVAEDVARQTGAAQTQQLNNIDIANAGVAEQNFQQGVGYQQNVMQNNFNVANQLALENANKLFTAIQTNTQNTQQTNMANAAAGQQLNAQQAQSKANFDATQGTQWTTAQLQQAMNALLGNTQNTINTNLNQAGLDRSQATSNLAANQNQWGAAVNALNSFSPIAGFSPQGMTSGIAPTLQNTGQSLTNAGTKILGAA